jgi:predicted glycoside hydrolase/deacetylase ChbG (UPF0249 family)
VGKGNYRNPQRGNIRSKGGIPEGKMNDRKLIIHADDAGMGNAVDEAIFQALIRGYATCASILVPAPWLMQVVKRWREHPEFDLGLHLCLTSEWEECRWGPVSSPAEVPGLLDEEGYLWRSVEQVVAHATREEVETEIRAQVQRALGLGLMPTHSDTHMGTLYATPQFFSAWMRVAEEFSIPPMLVSPESQVAQYRLKTQPQTLAPILAEMNTLPARFSILDELVMDVDPVELEPRRAAFREIVRSLRPGVTQIIVHFACDYPEMSAMDSLWARKRVNDYRIFSSPEMEELIEGQGISLIGWREFVDSIADSAMAR